MNSQQKTLEIIIILMSHSTVCSNKPRNFICVIMLDLEIPLEKSGNRPVYLLMVLCFVITMKYIIIVTEAVISALHVEK